MPSRRLLGVLLVVAALAVPAQVAAKSLGSVTSTSLGAWVLAGGTTVPTVVAWTPFTGANGTSLPGQTLNGTGTWASDSGTWTISSNRAGTTSAGLGNLDIHAGTQNATVVVTLIIGASANAGVVALRNNSNVALFATYSLASGGTIQLNKFNGSTSNLSTVTGVGTPSTAEFKLDATTNTIKISFNGTQVMSYALSAGDITALKAAANDRFGIFADNDAVTRFDDFHVDT